MRLGWAAPLLVVAGVAHADEARCPDGATTTLAIEQLERPELMRHDQPVGRDRLIMREGERELMHVDSDDAWWMCLGYSAQRGYLVGAQRERGATLVLASISYLPEDASALTPSVFTRKRYAAYAALVSPHGRWVAFLGGRAGEVALQLLDTRADTIRKLGPALKPPPYPIESCEEGFDWGVMCIDAYTEIEPELWQFEGDALIVSYGRDGAHARAKKRTRRRYRL